MKTFLVAAACFGALVVTAAAENFVVNVGPPVAAMGQPKKGNVFVVRPGGCPNPAGAQFSGAAEGVVNGTRHTVPLTLTPLATPGVHAVPQGWPNQGVWVISVSATCDGRVAGAIVSIGSTATFRREAVTLLPHAPTASEIESSLKSVGGR